MADKLKSRSRLILLLDAVILGCCILGYVQIVHRPDLGVVLERSGDFLLNPSGSAVVVSSDNDTVTSNGLFLPGDTIRLVSGYAVHSTEEVETIIDGLRIGGTVQVVLDRNGSTRTVIVHLTEYYESWYLLVTILAGMAFFWLGFIVHLRRPDSRVAMSFHWLAMCGAVQISLTWGSYTVLSPEIGTALRIIFMASYALVPTLFIHFTIVFPERKWSDKAFLRYFSYAISILLGVAAGTAFILFMSTGKQYHLYFTALTFQGCIVFFNIGVLVAAGNIVHSYWKATDETERRILRLMLIGLTGPLSFVFLYSLPSLLHGHPPVPEKVAITLLLIPPVCLIVAILKYNIMQVDIFIRRYVLLVLPLLGLYAVMDIIVSKRFGIDVEILLTISAVIFVIDFIVMGRARGKIRKFIDRKFFRIRYDFRETQRIFTDRIKQCLNLRELGEFIITETVKHIPVERIGLFLVDRESLRMRLLAHHNFEILENRSLRFRKEMLRTALEEPVALEGSVEPGTPYETGEEAMFHRWKISLVFSMLTERGDVVGFLVLGPTVSGSRFSLEDMDLLDSVTSQAGLAIERIQLERELMIEQAESDRLLQLNKLKSFFVSSVSHELKTPLTSIKMFAELLLHSPDTERQKVVEYLEIITGETDRLARLITNVLDYSKIERGAKEYEFADIDLNDVLQRVLSLMNYQFRMQRVKIETETAPEDLPVRADPDAMEQVLINLISNAIKYSRGDKHIKIVSGRIHDSVSLSVTDNGIGIPEKEIDTIFDAFHRVKDAGADRVAGAGLGLTLVKHIVDAHGGSIHVDSVPGEGSTFTLMLPFLVRSNTQ